MADVHFALHFIMRFDEEDRKWRLNNVIPVWLKSKDYVQLWVKYETIFAIVTFSSKEGVNIQLNTLRAIIITATDSLINITILPRKSRFPTCPCHKIYGVEAVSLSISNYTFKITFLWVSEIWDHLVKNWYFVNHCLIKVRI